MGGSGPGNFSRIKLQWITHLMVTWCSSIVVFIKRTFVSVHQSFNGMEKKTTIIDGGCSGLPFPSPLTIRVRGFTIQHAKDDVHSAGIEITKKDVS